MTRPTGEESVGCGLGPLLATAPGVAGVLDRLPCGCAREVTEDHELIVAQCAPHSATNHDFERSIMSGLDIELDNAVSAAATGKRVTRIWGDPSAAHAEKKQKTRRR